MSMEIEVVYTEKPNDKERLKRIAEILSEGVYAYLKKNELLKIARTERTKGTLCMVTEMEDQVAEENDGGRLKKPLDLWQEYIYNYGRIPDHLRRKENVEKDDH